MYAEPAVPASFSPPDDPVAETEPKGRGLLAFVVSALVAVLLILVVGFFFLRDDDDGGGEVATNTTTTLDETLPSTTTAPELTPQSSQTNSRTRSIVREGPTTESAEVTRVAVNTPATTLCVLAGESVDVLSQTSDQWVYVVGPIVGFINDALLSTFPTPNLPTCPDPLPQP